MVTKKRPFIILTAIVLLVSVGIIWYLTRQITATEKQAGPLPIIPDTSTVDTRSKTKRTKQTDGTFVLRRNSPVTSAPAKATASARSAKPVQEPEAEPERPAESPAPPRCDQLVLRNGDLLDVTITEVGISEIRYKKCNRSDGPTYAVDKRDVLSIRFADGAVERFTGSLTPSQVPAPTRFFSQRGNAG